MTELDLEKDEELKNKVIQFPKIGLVCKRNISVEQKQHLKKNKVLSLDSIEEFRDLDPNSLKKDITKESIKERNSSEQRVVNAFSKFDLKWPNKSIHGMRHLHKENLTVEGTFFVRILRHVERIFQEKKFSKLRKLKQAIDKLKSKLSRKQQAALKRQLISPSSKVKKVLTQSKSLEAKVKIIRKLSK